MTNPHTTVLARHRILKPEEMALWIIGDPIIEAPEKLTIFINGKRQEYRHLLKWQYRESRIYGRILTDDVAIWVDENLTNTVVKSIIDNRLSITFSCERDYVLFKTFWL